MMSFEDAEKRHLFGLEILDFVKVAAESCGLTKDPAVINDALEAAIIVNCLNNNINPIAEFRSCLLSAKIAGELMQNAEKEGDTDA